MWEPRALWSGMWGMGMAVGAQGIHERRTESFRRRDRDTVGANPQLIPFSLTPPKLPDSSLLSRSRSGSMHSLAQYTDKPHELRMQELQKPFWLMGTPKFLPRGHSGHHSSGGSWDLCQAGNCASSTAGTP